MDFIDPVMQGLAIKIKKLLPIYYDTLIKIVDEAIDPKERANAAEILAWSESREKTLNSAFDMNLFFDPNKKVRSRLYSSAYYSDINDENLLKKGIKTHCKLLGFPSFDDRQKALSRIINILSRHPYLASEVEIQCKTEIQTIRETSIFIDHQRFSKRILDMLKESSN